METATETERKYDVPESFELPDLTGAAGIARVDGAETHDLDATYFDTEDLRLMKNRRTLRRRSGGHDAGWHLKTPADGNGRKEHRMSGASEQVPDELRALVRTYVRRHPLGPVARLRTHRVETPLRDEAGRTLALIAQDQVRAESGDDHSAWQEIEVELVDGDEKVLAAVEKVLLAAGATPAAGPSKVARALAGRLSATRQDPKTEINPVSRYAREQRDAILEHDPAARQGEEEAVHKMRVATRRLRSTLKSFRRWFPERETAELGDELRWLAGALGAVRDPQVLEGKLLAGIDESVPEFRATAHRIRAALEHRVAHGREELVAALDSDRYLDLLDRIDALVDAPLPDTGNPAARARKVLAKADDRLDTALADGVDEEVHAARKKYKQARYAVELVAPEHGKRAKRLVKALTALQDGLGAHQDSSIARETLREIGPDSFHFGVLYGRQEAVGKETLIAVPALVRASRRKKVRRWLVKA
ncbi:CHAD domain-containing protein [Actinoplanes ianthinogenes]|uniref:CHAD domain-containing protein n=1 Tax=Actinoplanes ianthinogenes TaxID=122358 RepID=A0ABN6CFY7_9ACTN|nr:CYTH and CHAD domain-containing protein [Actinoplanes ianthinogenes]BCJ44465.1 CHAD domain-containing protein [Actinoplanes ianthinogenes]GGQ98128.1 CHAD domain-containing protein [Actinoplanes ianthinogenes]